MTLEELKIEADRLGYNLIKKPENIPHVKCKICNSKGKLLYVAENKEGVLIIGYIIKCEKCGIETQNKYSKATGAWKEWAKINE